MTTRAMGPLAGIGWLKNAINLGRHNPKAIFGGAALVLLAIGALMFAVVLAQLLLQPGPTGAIALSVLMVVLMLALVPAVTVGYLRLIHAVEIGLPARASDVFSTFKRPAETLRIIGFMALLTLVQYVLMFGSIFLLARDFGRWYLQAMQLSLDGGAPAQMTTLPAGFGLALLLIALIATLSYAIQAIGFGQIALRNRGVFGALADGVTGVAKNLLPLLVFIVACVGAALVLGVAVVLLAMLFGLLVKLVGMWLVVLVIPLYLAALLAMYVVMFGVMYHLWRDACGSDVVADPPADALSAGGFAA